MPICKTVVEQKQSSSNTPQMAQMQVEVALRICQERRAAWKVSVGLNAQQCRRLTFDTCSLCWTLTARHCVVNIQ